MESFWAEMATRKHKVTGDKESEKLAAVAQLVLFKRHLCCVIAEPSNVEPLTAEEVNKWSPPRVSPMARSYVLSAVKELDKKDKRAPTSTDFTPKVFVAPKVAAEKRPKELSKTGIQEAVKKSINSAVSEENPGLSTAFELEDAMTREPVKPSAKDVWSDNAVTSSPEPTSTPCLGQSPSLVQQKKEAAQDQIVHDFCHTKDGRDICSYCNKSICGHDKIMVNDPPTSSHIECFKCGECSMPLGDLMTAMFYHKGMIKCNGCINKIV
ncbi:hypothetical protein UPYG_G00120390 [Umbra pygmaea]|uniref:LIM zinc-binding domain-containing protein n=1 Tax=Umbra pygmaea TaxID=75934 RepID=A0ABD0X4V2_UMBPY